MSQGNTGRWHMWEQFTSIELLTIELALGTSPYSGEWEARLIRERVLYEMRRRGLEPLPPPEPPPAPERCSCGAPEPCLAPQWGGQHVPREVWQ
jgi:hypothetical protein